MTSTRCLILAATALLSTAALGRAAVDCPTRELNLAHVCVANDATCTQDSVQNPSPICTAVRPSNDCPDDGKCAIDFQKGPGTVFHGVLTIIVDESVDQMTYNQTGTNVVAATILLDLGKKGLISQIYQDPGLTFMSDFEGVPVTEFNISKLNDVDAETGKPHGINDLVFRRIDNEMGDALRAIFNVTGTPALKKVSTLQLTDHQGDGLATVVKLKVTGQFVQ
jgi:hypothetical protein